MQKDTSKTWAGIIIVSIAIAAIVWFQMKLTTDGCIDSQIGPHRYKTCEDWKGQVNTYHDTTNCCRRLQP